MRPVNKGRKPRDYNEYKYAKEDLIERLGHYCSYCEMNIQNQADVEHVSPKSKKPELELIWDNFLLGCKACNTLKKCHNDDRKGYPFPDKWNTAYLYTYKNGKVKIKENLSPLDNEKAEKLFKLVKLDRKKDTSNKIDDRYRGRDNAYKKALESLKDYKECPTDPMKRQIARSPEGFFSVWVEVFKEYPEVKKAILEKVPGTAMECYDTDIDPHKYINKIK